VSRSGSSPHYLDLAGLAATLAASGLLGICSMWRRRLASAADRSSRDAPRRGDESMTADPEWREESSVDEVGVVVDPCFEEHDTGPAHPERAERLAAIRAALRDADLGRRCRWLEPTAAGDDLLTLVHDPGYVRRVEQACSRGEGFLDSMDTAIGPASARIARLAAGSVVRLCGAVAKGAIDRGFAAVRPPGHHAERGLAMGFCLFNNVAIAARALQRHHGIARVLIVDWDVHHGNGTQHAFEEDPSIFYLSVHQFPLYPGTGRASERGRGAGEGTTRNLPLPPGSGDREFLAALEQGLDEAVSFAPEFVLVSAGFDAHHRDPLAQLEVTTEAYRDATMLVRRLAETHGGGRLVSVLEGGYDLQALTSSVAAHLGALLDSGP
jgi:acetoin utilization deacetylase AcuC-like enzyme